MDISSYVTVLPIVIICYLVGIGCKASKKISDKTIPVIVGIVGGIVAVPAMYVMKSFPAEDIITAISVGIMSGFASTGRMVRWYSTGPVGRSYRSYPIT